MNDSQTRRYDMFIRVGDFGAEHAAAFPPASLGGQKFAALSNVVDELEQHGTTQAASGGAARTSTDAKKAARENVRRKMAAISETARAMEPSRPGIAASFRMPTSEGDQALLNTARAFAEAATPLASEFIQREMPADFLEELTDAIETFESARNSQNVNTEKRVTATAAIEEVVDRGTALVRELDAIVRNKFRGDQATLAGWESARHVERSPRRTTSEPPPPPPQG
jgi:hypothetical protein